MAANESCAEFLFHARNFQRNLLSKSLKKKIDHLDMEKDDVDEWKLATIYATSVNHQVLAVKGRSRFGSLLTAESTNS